MTAATGQPSDAVWVARMGVWGARALGLVLTLALLFTMVNVQTFAAAGHPVGSALWWIAWLLDPMASITMGTAIVFEGLLAGYGRRVGWLTATKWYAGLCTWAMNIWVSMTSGSLAGVVLHSVAPGLVLLLAEASPRVRRHLAEIVTDLHDHPHGRYAPPVGPPAPDPTPVDLPPGTYPRVAPERLTCTPPPPPPRRAEPAQTATADVAPVAVTWPPVDPEPVTSRTPPTPPPVAGSEPEQRSRARPVGTAPQAGEDTLLDRVRDIVAEAASDGRSAGRRAVAQRLGITEHQARSALHLVGATTGATTGATRNGSRATEHPGPDQGGQ